MAHSSPGFIQENMVQLNLEKYTDTTITDEMELLAHLELVRKRGYSLDLGEHEQEVRCVAAPIFDQYGETIAAISVSGPRDRIDPIAQNKELIEGTLIAANNISKNLGYRNEII